MEKITFPEINIGVYVLERMKGFGDLPAMVDGGTDETMTYTELVKRTEMAAAGLQKFGIAKGDVICVISQNQLDFVVAFYASALIGSIFQPIDPSYSADDMRKSFRQCGPTFVMVTSEFVDKTENVLKDFDHIRVIVFGESDKFPSFVSLLDPNREYSTPDCDPKNDMVALLSSSGTTGFPKPIMMTHYAIVSNNIQLRHSNIFQPEDSFLVIVPLFHGYGLCLMAIFAHCIGAKIVVISKLDINTYIGHIRKHKPRILHVNTPVMVLLCKLPNLSESDFSSVEIIACGAAPLSEKVQDVVLKRLNVKYVLQAYGTTEVGLTHINTKEQNRQKSVGKPLSQTETKIVDEDGNEVAYNVEGEIWIRGPQLSKGYFNLPDENINLFTEDGWARTGDLGRQDEDGFLYVVDRLSELIKYMDYKVVPAVLEDILLRHDSVADAGVVGMPDEVAGELPRAYVVKQPETNITEKEILTFVEGLVAPHMKLRGGVEFVDAIPRKSGKILRKVLRERAKQTASSIKCG